MFFSFCFLIINRAREKRICFLETRRSLYQTFCTTSAQCYYTTTTTTTYNKYFVNKLFLITCTRRSTCFSLACFLIVHERTDFYKHIITCTRHTPFIVGKKNTRIECISSITFIRMIRFSRLVQTFSTTEPFF